MVPPVAIQGNSIGNSLTCGDALDASDGMAYSPLPGALLPHSRVMRASPQGWLVGVVLRFPSVVRPRKLSQACVNSYAVPPVGCQLGCHKPLTWGNVLPA